MSKRNVLAISVLICLAASVAAAAAVAPQGAALDELDEVAVVGKKLYQMRQDIVAAEDRFFALFNKLNTDNDFDVHCANDAPLGTRIKQRHCQPVFVEKAEAEEARAFITGEQVVPAAMVILAREDDYRKTALATINSNPQLLQLVREHERLQKLYAAAHKARFKGRWFLAR